MLKISRSDVQKLGNLSGEIEELFGKLDEVRNNFDSAVAAILEEIGEKQEEAREVLDDAANDAESYYDEKSEKWQEGERGQAYSEWKDRLREMADNLSEAIEEPEITFPDQPDWVAEINECEFAEFEF